MPAFQQSAASGFGERTCVQATMQACGSVCVCVLAYVGQVRVRVRVQAAARSDNLARWIPPTSRSKRSQAPNVQSYRARLNALCVFGVSMRLHLCYSTGRRVDPCSSSFLLIPPCPRAPCFLIVAFGPTTSCQHIINDWSFLFGSAALCALKATVLHPFRTTS